MNTSKYQKVDILGKNKAKKDAIIQSIANDAYIKQALIAARVNRSTYYKWLKIDENFRIDVDGAKGSRIGVVEDALYKNAKKGNVTAQIFFLCNRDPAKWRNVQKIQNEHSGSLTYEINYIEPNLKG